MAKHQSVLLKECIDCLNIKSSGIYVDGTFGRGGHSDEILKKLDQDAQLFVFDKDPEAILYARNKYQSDKRVTIHHGSFSDMKKVLQSYDMLESVDGILLDLGVSSPQIDQAERGFSFQKNGPLDMRMNPNVGISVKELLINTDEKDLADIIYKYGQERYSRRVASEIKKHLAKGGVLETTSDLANLVSKVIPNKEKHKHPATRVFQALRIYVNEELADLERLLSDVESLLSTGGRLCVISFHSLEDRIVKQYIQTQISGEQDKIPRGLPVAEHIPTFKWVHKKIKPSDDELKDNIRSRSATLRVAERLDS